MARTPDSTSLTPDQLASLKALNEQLRGIAGWLTPLEAWELHRRLRDFAVDEPVAVEIGNWKGRSTIALGLALQARGSGRLFSIDPHVDADHRYQEVLRHVTERNLEGFVTVVRAMSHKARRAVPQGPVHFVFIDGAHDYESVRRDVETWTPTLAPGAVVAFNDPMWPGVNRVLRERVATEGSPFRRARLVVNTLITEYRPGASWTPQDSARARALGRLLRWGAWFVRVRKPIQLFAPWPVQRAVGRYAAGRMYRIYPDIDLHHFDWLADESSREGRIRD